MRHGEECDKYLVFGDEDVDADGRVESMVNETRENKSSGGKDERDSNQSRKR